MVHMDIMPKGSKYIVKDAKNRQLYTIKKSTLSGKINLIDASGYKLYYVDYNPKEKKPIFYFYLNEKLIFQLHCTSLFLEPGFEGHGEIGNFKIISKDRRNFRITNSDEDEIGNLCVGITDKSGTHYHVELVDKYFDDYVPLFAACIDIAFGEINKG